jgi:hypothetical protein
MIKSFIIIILSYGTLLAQWQVISNQGNEAISFSIITNFSSGIYYYSLIFDNAILCTK